MHHRSRREFQPDGRPPVVPLIQLSLGGVTGENIRRVWANGPNDVWFVGQSGAGAALERRGLQQDRR